MIGVLGFGTKGKVSLAYVLWFCYLLIWRYQCYTTSCILFQHLPSGFKFIIRRKHEWLCQSAARQRSAELSPYVLDSSRAPLLHTANVDDGAIPSLSHRQVLSWKMTTSWRFVLRISWIRGVMAALVLAVELDSYVLSKAGRCGTPATVLPLPLQNDGLASTRLLQRGRTRGSFAFPLAVSFFFSGYWRNGETYSRWCGYTTARF